MAAHCDFDKYKHTDLILYVICHLLNQGMTTIGSCRYRQAIPVGFGGRLDIDANYGLRKAFLPQVLINNTNIIYIFMNLDIAC